MKTAIYFRKGKTIRDLKNNTDYSFEFINEAKRKSRELQKQADRALGRGSLAVVQKLPLFNQKVA